MFPFSKIWNCRSNWNYSCHSDISHGLNYGFKSWLSLVILNMLHWEYRSESFRTQVAVSCGLIELLFTLILDLQVSVRWQVLDFNLKYHFVLFYWRQKLTPSDSGCLFTCGDGSFGQLGHGDYQSCSSPMEVSFFNSKHVEQVACGMRHTLTLLKGKYCIVL